MTTPVFLNARFSSGIQPGDQKVIRTDAEEMACIISVQIREERLYHECSPVWMGDLPARLSQDVNIRRSAYADLDIGGLQLIDDRGAGFCRVYIRAQNLNIDE
jgi:hypothetical protein